MEKLYNLSIFAALFLFTFATSCEIALSLYPTPSPKYKIPTSPKSALGNPHSRQSTPKVEIVYPLLKPKVSPKSSSSIIVAPQSPSSGGLAPKSPTKRNLSPKPVEKSTSNSILTPHSTTKVSKTSPPKSNVSPRTAPRKYFPKHVAHKIPIGQQNLSPKPSPKPTRSHVSKYFHIRPKVGSHVSPKIAQINYKQPMNPKLAPKSTRRFSFNTHLSPKSTVTKPNVIPNPTGKIITKTRLAPKEAPKWTHKHTLTHGTY
ncbi:hypothetical protein P3S67_015039 [Capsicum chacoense]